MSAMSTTYKDAAGIQGMRVAGKLASEVLDYLKLPVTKTNIAGWQVVIYSKTESRDEPWATGAANPKELPPIRRNRTTLNRFGNYPESQQGVFAAYLAGWPTAREQIKSGITPGLEALRDERSGVLAIYLVIDPAAKTLGVQVGFTLWFPRNDSRTSFFFRSRGQE